MTDALFHQAIVEAARGASGHGRLEPADGHATVDNPLCGDRVSMELRLGKGRVTEVAHRVRGCLLCEAAAAIIADNAPGETPETLAQVGAAVRRMLDGDGPGEGAWPALAMFEPVHAYRSRHECVMLPFEALAKALGSVE